MSSNLAMVGTTFGTAEAITKSDSAANVYDAIYVGGAGDVALIAADSSVAVTIKAPPVGTILPIRTSKVMSTNTTATLLIGLRV